MSLNVSRDAALEPRDLHRDDDHVIVTDRHRDAMEPPLDEPVHVISKRKVAEAPKIRHYKGQSSQSSFCFKYRLCNVSKRKIWNILQAFRKLSICTLHVIHARTDTHNHNNNIRITRRDRAPPTNLTLKSTSKRASVSRHEHGS